MFVEIINGQAKVQCEICFSYRQINLRYKNKEIHTCRSCSAKQNIRPQNTKEYWTQDKKSIISEIIKSSDKYYESLKTRDTSGIHNGMFNKHHTDITKSKMSVARTGKTGENSTAWKGGKASVCKRVKKILQTRHKWFTRVFDKFGCRCVKCGVNKKLDAHHIKPVAKIIKELCINKVFIDDNEKVDWLSNHEILVDIETKNGIVLCRECHKQEHNNWGSHANP